MVPRDVSSPRWRQARFAPRTRAAAPACSGNGAATSRGNVFAVCVGRLTLNLEINGVGYAPRRTPRLLKLADRLQPRSSSGPNPGRHPDQGCEATEVEIHRRGSIRRSDSSRRRSAACVAGALPRARATSIAEKIRRKEGKKT